VKPTSLSKSNLDWVRNATKYLHFFEFLHSRLAECVQTSSQLLHQTTLLSNLDVGSFPSRIILRQNILKTVHKIRLILEKDLDTSLHFIDRFSTIHIIRKDLQELLIGFILFRKESLLQKMSAVDPRTYFPASRNPQKQLHHPLSQTIRQGWEQKQLRTWTSCI